MNSSQRLLRYVAKKTELIEGKKENCDISLALCLALSPIALVIINCASILKYVSQHKRTLIA